jgi:8-oxo-dGTP diphosphatase
MSSTTSTEAVATAAKSTSTKQPQQHVRVGVGVIVRATVPGRTETDCCGVWAGIRKSSHGAGSLALPGGHLEMNESWEQCAAREVKEEMNLDLDVTDLRVAHVTNDIMLEEEKHYVTIFIMGRPIQDTAVPENTEPDKCEGWKIYQWDELKEMAETETCNIFGPLRKLLQDEPPALLQYLREK